MTDKKKKKKWIKKLTDKYHLKIFNEKTLEEVLSFRLTRLNLFAFGGVIVLLLTSIVTVIIAFTPLREFIPGYPKANIRGNIINNALKTDSLEQELKLKDQYFENLRSIIQGNEPANHEHSKDTGINNENISFNQSDEDSIFRSLIEKEEYFNLMSSEEKIKSNNIKDYVFFPPLKGMITNHFNPNEQHFGIDIVASRNEKIFSVLDGTVIIASWTLETGYIIQIQHDNNLISVYKHNAELLKQSGVRVKAGEPIAIFGNTGELSSGPHLHFELWYQGMPQNPEDYIIF